MQERELLARARLGDKAALGEIVLLYYNDIYKFLVRRTGSPLAAQDITQNTFLNFVSAFRSYKDKNKLRSYLFKIAVNCSNDYFRSEKSTLPFEAYENAEGGVTVEESIDSLSQKEIVKQAVNSLPKWQKDVVILRYYHDMKLSEIALILDIPLATAKTRLHRASKALKKILERSAEYEKV